MITMIVAPAIEKKSEESGFDGRNLTLSPMVPWRLVACRRCWVALGAAPLPRRLFAGAWGNLVQMRWDRGCEGLRLATLAPNETDPRCTMRGAPEPWV